MRTVPTRAGRRTGQAVVEFALVLPVFLLLVFGTIEFGRAYLTLHLLTNASREGARVGSLPGNLEAAVTTAVTDFLTAAGLTGAQPPTTMVFPEGVAMTTGNERAGGLTDAVQGDRIQVTVAYSFVVLSGTIIPGFSGTVPLQAVCVYRHE